MGSGGKEPPPPEENKPIVSTSAPVKYAVTQERGVLKQKQEQADANDPLSLLGEDQQPRNKNLLG